jgi:nicotinamide-nucleotide amidase
MPLQPLLRADRKRDTGVKTMRAEVIAFGDELISGQRLDTNSQWLSQQLGELGIRVQYHTTVGDDLESSSDAFRTAARRVDLILSSGGLGPTADDLTRHALAAVLGRELELNDSVWNHIRALFQRRGRVMPERNRIQAMLPVGSQPIKNPHGTAPGIHATLDRPDSPPVHVFVLPGVPAEMREMWSESLEPHLRQLLGPQRRTIVHRRIKCFGVGESELEQMLPELTERGRTPSVGITVHRATITLRVTAEGENVQQCHAAMQPTIDAIHQSLGPLVYGQEDDELQDAVVRGLEQLGRTLATVETATEGMVARWLAAAAAGSTLYRGGKILPSDAWRPADTLGGGAAEVAKMAEAVRSEFHADYGLAVGPVPAGPTNGGPPQIRFALATSSAVTEDSRPFASHPDIRLSLAAKHALNLVRLSLSGQGAG